MSKKGTEYCAQLPDWYWKRGLHDAKILSVCEMELVPDWKEKHPKRNCLEILLDGKNALFETNMKKISLYNYRITDMNMNGVKPIILEVFRNVYWLGDSIDRLEDGKFLLEIECIDSRSNLMSLNVKFEIPEIERI
ncbi:MAG: hypothetical protein IKK17_01200 [Oscillospiraceae bacterium]|nr:hypothetical protein [Oscillospiraceae bacterium]